MTTTAAPTVFERVERVDPRRRHRWRRLARVVWLQHRGSAISILVAFIALAVAIVVEESTVHASYVSYLANGCVARPHHVPCGIFTNAATNESSAFNALTVALRVGVVLVGVFIGAPLVAREMDSGTYRFVWTQGVGRTRFVLSSLVVLAAFVVSLAVLLGLLFGGWYAHPFEVINGAVASQWEGGLFGTTWWMLGLWTLFALLLGTFLGAVIKRTVAAMAVTAGLLGVLLIAASTLLPHVLRIGALVSSHLTGDNMTVGTIGMAAFPGGGPVGSWLVRSWITGPNGQLLGTRAANLVQGQAMEAKPNMASWLSLHHYTYWVSYQPASHFWMFQGVVGVVLVALTLVCAVATLRTLRLRVRS